MRKFNKKKKQNTIYKEGSKKQCCYLKRGAKHPESVGVKKMGRTFDCSTSTQSIDKSGHLRESI